MSTLRRSSLVAAGLGAGAFLLTLLTLPRLLAWSGVAERAAAGETMYVLMYIAPFGLLALGLFGLGAQELHLSGWVAPTAVISLAAVVNGACWALLLELARWARVRSRPVFLALLLVIGLYWVILLSMAVM